MISNNRTIDLNKIEAVIFDMDGVLVDSEPVYYKVEQELFRSLDLNISPEKHHTFVGMSIKLIWKKIRETNKLELSDSELIDLHKKMMIRGFRSLSNPLPIKGINTLLEYLSNNDIDMAIASSSSHELIDVILSKIGIKKFFPVIISGDDVINGKPDPDIFLKTLKELNRTAEKTIIIEDSTNGIMAAIKADIPCIAYKNKNSGEQILNNADMIITGVTDQFRILIDLITGQFCPEKAF